MYSCHFTAWSSYAEQCTTKTCNGVNVFCGRCETVGLPDLSLSHLSNAWSIYLHLWKVCTWPRIIGNSSITKHKICGGQQLMLTWWWCQVDCSRIQQSYANARSCFLGIIWVLLHGIFWFETTLLRLEQQQANISWHFDSDQAPLRTIWRFPSDLQYLPNALCWTCIIIRSPGSQQRGNGISAAAGFWFKRPSNGWSCCWATLGAENWQQWQAQWVEIVCWSSPTRGDTSSVDTS